MVLRFRARGTRINQQSSVKHIQSLEIRLFCPFLELIKIRQRLTANIQVLNTPQLSNRGVSSNFKHSTNAEKHLRSVVFQPELCHRQSSTQCVGFRQKSKHPRTIFIRTETSGDQFRRVGWKFAVQNCSNCCVYTHPPTCQ